MRPVESLQSRRVAWLHPWVSVSTFLIRSSLIADLYFALGGVCLPVSRRLRWLYLQTNDGITTRSWCAGCARRGVPMLQQLSFANHLHCASHLPHFHLLWKRLLLSAHDATHSHYGGSAIDLQFCCPFDKGKKRKLPLALFYLCSSHCAIFMSSLKVSKVSSAKHFVVP